METLIRQSIEDFSLIPPGTRVLVAISGGADSTALLHVLSRLGAQMGFSVAAAHLNHGIRSAAALDAAHVAYLCHDLGIQCVFGAVDVPGYAYAEKMGLEEAGRELRYPFLRNAARMCGCSRIATAHHQQDQAETLIMRLARGTSVSGLKGIPVCHLPFIRPMLTVERSRVEAYLKQHGLENVEDESNSDCSFTRNRVRHKLMPLLEGVHPQAQKHMAQLAQQVSLEEDYWAKEVEKVLKKARFYASETRIHHADLVSLHPGLRQRVIRAVLERLRGGLRGLERKHLHAVESMLMSSRPQLQLDLPEAWVARRYADVVFRRQAPPAEVPPYQIVIEGPGTYALPDGSSVEVRLSRTASGETRYRKELDGKELEWPVYVRSKRPGDRLKCEGMSGSKKLKDLLAERRIEAEQRKSLPLLCNQQGEVLWVMGVRRSRLWSCAPSSPRVVQILFNPAGSKI